MKNLLCLIAVTIFSFGCASVPSTPDPLNPLATHFQPDAGQATLYIIRQMDSAGTGTYLRSLLDGNSLGLLSVGAYQSIRVTPGNHTLAIKVSADELETIPPGSFNNDSEVKFKAQAGSNYFFYASLRRNGPQPGLYLWGIANLEGQKAVALSHYASGEDALTPPSK